ncbi:nodulation protein NfeD [Paenibacillus sp. GSMTC-2017]|nr:nodulation protein NfeD [Paenibacillus sp. GSMTC-2017]
MIFFPLMLFAIVCFTLGMVVVPSAYANGDDTSKSKEVGTAVIVIPIKHTVEQGLQSFLERAFKEAEEANAEHIILVVNTLGGRVDSASEIGELIRSSKIPTTAFVEGKAVSAGTYIALNANNIVMQPGSIIGSAAVVNGDGKLIEDPKTISYWVGKMSAAAKLNGRDAAIAAAMVDTNVTVKLSNLIGRDKKAGEILSLSASDAEKVGYSEHTAESVEEVVTWLQLENRTIIEIEPSIAEKVARFLVNPIVATILLILGIAGIAIEMLVPGYGAPGIIGLLSFGLYFFGSYIAGFAGMESVVLFIIGIILLVLEFFIPSFGILGLLGSASLVTGVVIAAPTPTSGLISLLVAVVVATVPVILFAKSNKGRGVWNKFILREQLSTENGFLSADLKTSLIGQQGVSLTTLRPSGIALIGEERVDVVTEGEFIDVNKPVQVVKAEGTWVFVKELNK